MGKPTQPEDEPLCSTPPCPFSWGAGMMVGGPAAWTMKWARGLKPQTELVGQDNRKSLDFFWWWRCHPGPPHTREKHTFILRKLLLIGTYNLNWYYTFFLRDLWEDMRSQKRSPQCCLVLTLLWPFQMKGILKPDFFFFFLLPFWLCTIAGVIISELRSGHSHAYNPFHGCLPLDSRVKRKAPGVWPLPTFPASSHTFLGTAAAILFPSREPAPG